MTIAVLAVAVIGCASTAKGPVSPAPAAAAANLYARIPDTIDSFRLTERTIVRGAPSDSVFRFRDGSQTNVTLIIYDVPDLVKVGADSQLWTPREGERFAQVQQVQRQRGLIADFRVSFSDTARVPGTNGALLEHSIGISTRLRDGRIVMERQYLYLIGGKFVKVRATIPGTSWQNSRVPAFARDLALRLAGTG